jgi:hypothetical protein
MRRPALAASPNPGCLIQADPIEQVSVGWRPPWFLPMDLFQPASGLPEIGNKRGGGRNKSRLKRIVSM